MINSVKEPMIAKHELLISLHECSNSCLWNFKLNIICISVTDSLLRNFQMDLMDIGVVNGGPRGTYFLTQRGNHLSRCLSICIEKELLYTMWYHTTTVTCGVLGSETTRSVYYSFLNNHLKRQVNKRNSLNKIDDIYYVECFAP